VGMAAGAYSSIFIATPFLAQLKSRQPEMKALTGRVLARRKQGGASEASGTAVSGILTDTRVASGPRQQPRRQPRSRRSR
ncbi:MAG: hypothetical protein ORN20_00870, partial [Candidatus Nanopelagicales bacterium]|nr:hypothetical protein [Candidatus Nanopelagicales bacterium]